MFSLWSTCADDNRTIFVASVGAYAIPNFFYVKKSGGGSGYAGVSVLMVFYGTTIGAILSSLPVCMCTHEHVLTGPGGGGAGFKLSREGSLTFPSLTVPEANVAEGMTSSAFEIAGLATIPSDNSAHKVSTSWYFYLFREPLYFLLSFKEPLYLLRICNC